MNKTADIHNEITTVNLSPCFHSCEIKITNWNLQWKRWYWSFMSILRRVHTSFEQNFFTSTVYNVHIARLELLRDKYESLPLPLEFENWVNWGEENCLLSYAVLTKDLQQESLILGAWSISDFGHIWYPDWDWSLEESNRCTLFELFEYLFVPIGGYLQTGEDVNICTESWASCTPHKEENRNHKDLPTVQKCLHIIPDLHLPFLQHLEEAEIYITLPNNKNIWIIGYFIQDNVNISRIHGFLKQKQPEILERCQMKGIPESFIVGWIRQISLRDYLIYSIHELATGIINGYRELTTIRETPLSVFVKEFLRTYVIHQRYTLILLLLGNQDDQFLANIIFDMISCRSGLLKPSPFAEEIYKSLHHSIQKLFTKASVRMEQNILAVSNFTEEQIPYDKRITLMKVPVFVKNKAMDKLREIKGMKDTSSKAQQYLDGLLKIPFGTYRVESIFYFFGEFRKRLRIGIDDLRKDWETWKPSIENGDLWLYQRWGVLFEWWNKPEDWTEHFIESGFQHILDELDLLQEARTVSSDNSDNDDNINVGKMHPALPLPSNIEAHYIQIEQQLKNWIEEWQRFSVQKTEYFAGVRETLDSCVYGHKETKLQIERLLAQWIHGKMEGVVFGFQGPPGVGKTVLARKGFARCFTNNDGNPRPFGFLPLGGATDGSFLEGHNYTYLGSMWGRIVDILIETKCMNPIIYIDEIDKVSQTVHGKEIIGIMTRLTDPSQNQEFFDRFFSGIAIDLSKVIFIFSYNDANAVDQILRDRITEIQVHPLTTNDKIQIVQNYSLPEILNTVGYCKDDIIIERDVIERLIQDFTQEAGVRKLNEKIFEIIRELNLRRLVDPSSIEFPFELTWDWINTLFRDKPRTHFTKILSMPCVGLVNGLYATSAGVGGLQVIQCLKFPSDIKLQLELTGQQGDVMKESMICAKTLTWNLLNIIYKKSLRKEWDEVGIFGLHVHCPEAATPKDGPSAGVAITVAMVSRLTGIAVLNDIAMTGEVDLQGNIHAVGGIDSKLTGALRGGVKCVFLPSDNQRDVHNIKRDQACDNVPFWLDGLKIQYVTRIEEILAEAFVKPFLTDE